MAHLKKLTSLEVLILSSTEITDAGLEHLKDLPLNTLDLNLCFNLTDAGLEHLKGLPLKTLNLFDSLFCSIVFFFVIIFHIHKI